MRGIVRYAVRFAVRGRAQRDTLPPTARHVRPCFAGTWSFDGTCASGDGMAPASATARRATTNGARACGRSPRTTRAFVIIAEDISEEADRRKEAELIELRMTVAQRATLCR